MSLLIVFCLQKSIIIQIRGKHKFLLQKTLRFPAFFCFFVTVHDLTAPHFINLSYYI
jgi:hypothetical protein